MKIEQRSLPFSLDQINVGETLAYFSDGIQYRFQVNDKDARMLPLVDVSAVAVDRNVNSRLVSKLNSSNISGVVLGTTVKVHAGQTGNRIHKGRLHVEGGMILGYIGEDNFEFKNDQGTVIEYPNLPESIRSEPLDIVLETLHDGELTRSSFPLPTNCGVVILNSSYVS